MAFPAGSVIGATALVGTLLSAVLLGVYAGRPLPVNGPTRPPGVLLHPWTLFLLTSALALANQVALNAWLLATHHGDPSFLRRSVGAAYFHLDLDFPGVRALAEALGPEGAERWLSLSLLRVNALLELPFALFAYLAITRLFDRAAYRFLLRSPLGLLGAASFTVILCVIEVLLRNPWTDQDLVLRGVALVLVAPLLGWLGRRERGAPCFPDEDGRPRSFTGLLVALGGAAALAASLLLLYDVTLLYNLGHLRRFLPPLLGGLALATGAVLLGPVLEARQPRAPAASVAAVTSVASLFSLAFFVPSLAIRYGLSRPLCQGCGLVLLGGALLWGLVRAARAPETRRVRWCLGLLLSTLAGLGAEVLAHPLLTHSGLIAEAMLLARVTLFLGPWLVTWRALEALGLDARSPPT